MATVSAVNRPNGQSRAGLGAVLKYTMQEKKTVWEDEKLVSGLNCIPENAYDEFIGTKVQFGKDGGRMYYHFVQSFPPDEKITPKLAHEFALEFAKHWQGFEVVVSTHSDRDHVHSHFIINSVSFEDGKKYHCDRDEIKALQRLNDELCMRFGYSVCRKKKQTEGTQNMSQAEYHSALRSESWKMALRIAIDDAMKYAVSREQFVEFMRSEGYGITWTGSRKNITYTCPNGKKCRDSKLNESKYLKEAMENEFRIREHLIPGASQAAGENQRGESEGSGNYGHSHGRQLGSADRQRTASDRCDGAEHGQAAGAYDGGTDGGADVGAGRTAGGRPGGDSGEDRRYAVSDAADAGQFVVGDQGADGEIGIRDIRTGWESERAILLGVLRGGEKTEKMGPKDHLDKSHTVGRGPSVGAAALGLVNGLAYSFGDDGQSGDGGEDDDDDIDKQLRREIRAVKDGQVLVM